MDKYDYRSNKDLKVAIGIYFGVIGGLFISLSLYLVSNQDYAFFVAVFVFFLLIVFVCFTYKTTVRIDLRNKIIMRKREVMFFSIKDSYKLSDFKAVEICSFFSATGFLDYKVNVSYCIALAGDKKIRMPGSASSDFEEIFVRGQRLSELIGLPLKYSCLAGS